MASDFDNETKRVAIRTFSNHEAAELAVANLEAHGIECQLTADDCGGMYPNLTTASGVRLLVSASDAEAAIALLNAQASPAEINQIETEAANFPPPEIPPTIKFAWGQIVFGIAMGVILCLLYQWVTSRGMKTYYHYTYADKADNKWVYRNGYIAEFSNDRNLDGAWDEWVHYDKYGRLTASEADNNFDGNPDEFWTYSRGIPDTQRRDTDFKDAPDMICTYENGVLVQEDVMPNGAKFPVTRQIFQNGILTEIRRGGDSNGNFSEVVRYDPFFNPINTNTPVLLIPNLK
jgi:hypothetical protein